MRNRYPGTCFVCGRHVAEGQGYFQRNMGKDQVRPDLSSNWLVRCIACVGKGNATPSPKPIPTTGSGHFEVEGLTVLVCGSPFSDFALLRRYLDHIHAKKPIGLIMEGEARGDDGCARDWAISREVDFVPFPVDWRWGPAPSLSKAPPLPKGRPDLVVSPGDAEPGDMASKAAAIGVPIYRISERAKA